LDDVVVDRLERENAAVRQRAPVTLPSADAEVELELSLGGFTTGCSIARPTPTPRSSAGLRAHPRTARAAAQAGGTTYTFVTDGLEAALEQASAAAGDKDVGIWGGANVLQQYLKAGLLDEMQIHLVPVLLGEGVRLFEQLGRKRIELERTRAIETPSATHLRFTVVK
jgi:hypothetical protein